MKKRQFIFILTSFILCSIHTNAQKENLFLKELEKFHFKAYGVVNYYNFDWDSDPKRNDAFDTERLNMYLKYDFTEKIQLKVEFEYEHGGTGVTMELDRFEEAGEFETEVEAGGEVKIDQLNILFNYKPWLNFRIGRVKLYMGNASKIDESTKYFTGYRSVMENTLLPVGWYENGIELLGDLGKDKDFSYKLFFVNGLNSEAFSSANWIKRGHQQRFETINADGFAVSARFDYNLPNDGYVGVSGYNGDANKNRHEGQLQNTKGNVSIGDFHFNIVQKNWKLRGMFLYGNLQNSDDISRANRNLSNNLNVKRTPVAKNALGYYIEGAYDILSLKKNKTKKQLFLFGRYDFYDSMYETTGVILNNPRWERSVITFGANYFIHPHVVLKSHYSVNSLGVNLIDGFGDVIGNKERTFLIGMAFDLATK